ncbi:hypothetical protein BPA30113_06868 [Burkholderia paludis]|uniref:Uncharacterized protein n=1 Tax=Burkholderia paludis TaxID=1506587 RepID=A0A6P2S3P9_9BURK|nr:hypothetical protein LMG30113_06347 [Burkholderia paludis]VWC40373.1 hypothetical protein BPA30113_06868 [Burkholderia paludis]
MPNRPGRAHSRCASMCARMRRAPSSGVQVDVSMHIAYGRV